MNRIINILRVFFVGLECNERQIFFRYMRSMILGSLTKSNAISDKIIMNFHVDKCVYRVYFNL